MNYTKEVETIHARAKGVGCFEVKIIGRRSKKPHLVCPGEGNLDCEHMIFAPFGAIFCRLNVGLGHKPVLCKSTFSEKNKSLE